MRPSVLYIMFFLLLISISLIKIHTLVISRFKRISLRILCPIKGFPYLRQSNYTQY